jgi:hypothetical protein
MVANKRLLPGNKPNNFHSYSRKRLYACDLLIGSSHGLPLRDILQCATYHCLHNCHNYDDYAYDNDGNMHNVSSWPVYVKLPRLCG